MQIGALVQGIGSTLAQVMAAANAPLVQAVQEGMQAHAATMAAVVASMQQGSGSGSSSSGSSGHAPGFSSAQFDAEMARWRRERREDADKDDSEELLCTNSVSVSRKLGCGPCIALWALVPAPHFHHMRNAKSS